MEEVNRNNANGSFPTPYLAVDETLYRYCEHISFKQYYLSKPAKYRLLYRSRCDSAVPSSTLLYARKPSIVHEEAIKYYVTGTDEYTKHVILGPTNYTSVIECNVSMDHYFTSILLAHWFSEKGFKVVGTISQNQKGIPKEIKAME